MSAPKTSAELQAEIDAKRAKLDELQSEQDDAKWMASQNARNGLESELREMGQLLVRVTQREQTEAAEKQRAALQKARATAAADVPELAQLAELVKRATAEILPTLAAAQRSLHSKQMAVMEAGRLERALGVAQSMPAGGAHRIAVIDIQRQLWAQLEAAGALDLRETLAELFTADATTPLHEQAWWQAEVASLPRRERKIVAEAESE